MAAPAENLVGDTDVVAQTVRLTLRWPQPKDVALWAAYLGDFDVSKMLARVPFHIRRRIPSIGRRALRLTAPAAKP